MDAELKSVHEHMLRLALGALAHANWHAHFKSWDNDCWAELSVLQAAHAGEIFLKARIAQEHPLLIFEQLPKTSQVGEPHLSLAHLFERGRTVQFADLPERLWAAAGVRLENADRYQEFGRLRNAVQHFVTPTKRDVASETSHFIYGVIELCRGSTTTISSGPSCGLFLKHGGASTYRCQRPQPPRVFEERPTSCT